MKQETSASNPAFYAFEESDSKARQLVALLDMTWGGSGMHFRGMDENAQDYYLWACADLARQIVKLHEVQYEAPRNGTAPLRSAT